MIAATVLVVARGVPAADRHAGHPGRWCSLWSGCSSGRLVIDEVTAASTGEGVRTLVETTLAVVLFADASGIKLAC